MLARVTGGRNGIVEYLEHGIKSGRELSRDELDERVCIDGNLSVTDEIITQLNNNGRENNYLHITLSFGEKDISEECIVEAYDAYKEKIMNAYNCDEYNIYAEIHFPKVKSYKDRKTGDIIERLPHVHIVIPKVNLASHKALDPYGYYNVESHDSIQEYVNRKCKLESPYDHQRKYRIVKDDAEFISRYKGDHFKGSNSEFKNELFELVNSKNIRSMDDFRKELTNYGKVSTGRLGSSNEYLKIKLTGQSKYIRLKETCFNSDYIVDRQLLRPKPTDKQVNTLVNEWVDIRSHEMKHIQPASPKLRKTYYALEPEQKQEFLNERRREHNQKYDLGERRRTTNRKLGVERVGLKRFAEIRNGLPSMPQRGLVRTNRERSDISKSILSSDANNNLESSRTSRDHELRRVIDRGRGVGGGRLNHKRVEVGLPKPLIQAKEAVQKSVSSKPRTLSEQFLQEHVKSQLMQNEVEHFRVVRQTLDPKYILNHFEKSHGLVSENYTTFKAKDGSARIKIGTRAYNVSDFCTKHMRQNWEYTKTVLNVAYQTQKNEKEDKHVINSIVFATRYATQGYTSKDKLSRLDESIMILKHLQQQEKYGVKDMSLAELQKHRVKSDLLDSNSISNAEISLLKSADNFKRQQAIAKQLSLKMGDLVAVKDIKNKRVEFSDKNTGEKIFKDIGNKLVMTNRKPELDHVAAAMTLAAEKFGAIKITGTKEFKQQVIDVAITKNLNVVFDSPKMQEMFIQQKEEHTQKLALEKVINQDVDKEPLVMDSKVEADKSEDKQSNEQLTKAITLVSFGSAPYLNDKNNKESYSVTLSNGETLWGVGLKDAIAKSEAKVGDEVSINKEGTETVKVDVNVKDDQGKVIAVESQNVERGIWKVEVKNIIASLPTSEKQTIVSGQEPMKQNETVAYNVTYQWSKNDKKMVVQINNEIPKTLDPKILNNIITNDKFLSNYSLENVQSGKLDLSVANGIQPVPKQFDKEGQVVQVHVTTNAKTLH